MPINYHYYRGYRFQLSPIFESTESRLARKDYRSKIVAYRVSIQMPIKPKGFSHLKGEYQFEEYPTQAAAITAGHTLIDIHIAVNPTEK